ncbi:MAG: hypothetical protein ACAH83_13885 [Alphaproteobacteria bacterium]
MKDDFNFEQVLGRLAQCVADKNYYGVKEPLKTLIAHAKATEVITTLTDTLDYLSEEAGAPFMVDLLDGLLDDLKTPKTIEANYLQAKLVEKWTAALDDGVATQPDSMLSYLTGACRADDGAHPLSAAYLPRWTALVESQWPLQGFDLECTLAVDSDIKNAAFRRLALTKLDSLKDTDPDTVMKMLDRAINNGYYSFKNKDPESVGMLIGTMADILDSTKQKLKPDQIVDIAWKLISRGEGLNPAGEKKAARCYLDAVAGEADNNTAFNRYSSLMRFDKGAPDEAREAKIRILDLVDAGKLKGCDNGYDEVVRCVSEEIFSAAAKDPAKDAALAERAADTLLSVVHEELSKPGTGRRPLYYNCAVRLFDYFESGDVRGLEAKKLWQDGLARDYSADDDYYARQMGWMLDVAARKGDVALADFTRKQWLGSIEMTAKTFPRDAHRTVNEIVVNAVHYSPQSALLAEARALLPDLERRAGIKKAPEKVNTEDFLKMIGKKKGTGFKP